MNEPANGGSVLWRLSELERTVQDLEHKVDRLVMALVTSALMIAVSVIAFAITLTTAGHG